MDDIGEENELVKVFETVKLLSLDIIMQCVFSFESNCQQPREGI